MSRLFFKNKDYEVSHNKSTISTSLTKTKSKMAFLSAVNATKPVKKQSLDEKMLKELGINQVLAHSPNPWYTTSEFKRKKELKTKNVFIKRYGKVLYESFFNEVSATRLQASSYGVSMSQQKKVDGTLRTSYGMVDSVQEIDHGTLRTVLSQRDNKSTPLIHRSFNSKLDSFSLPILVSNTISRLNKNSGSSSNYYGVTQISADKKSLPGLSRRNDKSSSDQVDIFKDTTKIFQDSELVEQYHVQALKDLKKNGFKNYYEVSHLSETETPDIVGQKNGTLPELHGTREREWDTPSLASKKDMARQPGLWNTPYRRDDGVSHEKDKVPNFNAPEFYTSYSKTAEIKLITIGLASPNTIRQWAEKHLPNGKVIGQVTNANTLHHKTFKPIKGGLFCERIFGPLKDFECACGKSQKPSFGLMAKPAKAVGILNENSSSSVGDSVIVESASALTKRYFCPDCDVEYTWSVVRRYQLGYIQLVAPVTHVWYLKGTPSYISILLGTKKKYLEYSTYSSEMFTLENYLRTGDSYPDALPTFIPKAARFNWNTYGTPRDSDMLDIKTKSLPDAIYQLSQRDNAVYQSKLKSKEKKIQKAKTLKHSINIYWYYGVTQNIKFSKNTQLSSGLRTPFVSKLNNGIHRQCTVNPARRSLPSLSLHNGTLRTEGTEFTIIMPKTLNKWVFTKQADNIDLKNYISHTYNSYFKTLTIGSAFRNLTKNRKIKRKLAKLSLKLITSKVQILYHDSFIKHLHKKLPILSTTSDLQPGLRNSTESYAVQDIWDTSKIESNFKSPHSGQTDKRRTPIMVDLPVLMANYYAQDILAGKNSIAMLIQKAWSVVYKKAYKKASLRANQITDKLVFMDGIWDTSDQRDSSTCYTPFSSAAWDMAKPLTKFLNNASLPTYLLGLTRQNLLTVLKFYKPDSTKGNKDWVSTFLTRNLKYKIYLASQAVRSFLRPSKIWVTKTVLNKNLIDIENAYYMDDLLSLERNQQTNILAKAKVLGFLLGKTKKCNLIVDFLADNLLNPLILNRLFGQMINTSLQHIESSFSVVCQHKVHIATPGTLPGLHGTREREWDTSSYRTKSTLQSIIQGTISHKKSSTILKPTETLMLMVHSVENALVDAELLNIWDTSSIKYVNKAYCLSHREMWQTERDWQYFSFYFKAPTDGKDTPIPSYSHCFSDSVPLKIASNFRSVPFNNGFSVINGESDKREALNSLVLPARRSLPSLSLHNSRKVNSFANSASVSGAGVIQKLLEEFDFYGLQMIDKQNRILLFELNKFIFYLKSRLGFDKKAKKQLRETFEQKDLLMRRIKFIREFYKKNTKADCMVISLLPVLPPDLRPIVKIGNQTTVSDLNRLYQRVIYRNDRLKKILKDNAISNSYEMKYAQRLLQESVDNLIQNGKSGVVPEKDSRGRALKSLSDILKGKQGRFRQYLLGKRVDYSGRSVIVVGPKLQIHECGIPKEMALELYLPFLLKRILNQNLARTVVGAKALIKANPTLAWQMLREIMQVCPVLLNRAPTLHRLGFQAFQPKLVEGRAILLHPLVCPAFNADFDGDQMAVHIPITVEARAEAWKLMLSRNNLLSPATGDPLMLPSQDMVLGCYYLTTNCNPADTLFQRGSSLYFNNFEDVLKAYNQQIIDLHSAVWVKWEGFVETGNDQEQPLEIRITLTGHWQEMCIKSQRNFDSNGFLVNQYIRTTPGKILFNMITQKCLTTASQTNVKSKLLKTFEKQIKRYSQNRIIKGIKS